METCLFLSTAKLGVRVHEPI